MMLTPHLLTGAVIGSVTDASPVGIISAIILGLASHYALDKIPHWERLFGQHFNDKLPKNHYKWPRNILLQGGADAFVSIMFLRYFTYHAPLNNAWGIFYGGMAGVFPDILDNMPFWSKWTKKIPLWHQIEALHRNIHIKAKDQRKMPKYTGLITQIITCSLMIVILVIRTN